MDALLPDDFLDPTEAPEPLSPDMAKYPPLASLRFDRALPFAALLKRGRRVGLAVLAVALVLDRDGDLGLVLPGPSLYRRERSLEVAEQLLEWAAGTVTKDGGHVEIVAAPPAA